MQVTNISLPKGILEPSLSLSLLVFIRQYNFQDYFDYSLRCRIYSALNALMLHWDKSAPLHELSAKRSFDLLAPIHLIGKRGPIVIYAIAKIDTLSILTRLICRENIFTHSVLIHTNNPLIVSRLAAKKHCCFGVAGVSALLFWWHSFIVTLQLTSKNLVLERTTHYKNTALKPVTTYFQTYKIGTNFQPILEVKISAKAT